MFLLKQLLLTWEALQRPEYLFLSYEKKEYMNCHVCCCFIFSFPLLVIVVSFNVDSSLFCSSFLIRLSRIVSIVFIVDESVYGVTNRTSWAEESWLNLSSRRAKRSRQEPYTHITKNNNQSNNQITTSTTTTTTTMMMMKKIERIYVWLSI